MNESDKNLHFKNYNFIERFLTPSADELSYFCEDSLNLKDDMYKKISEDILVLNLIMEVLDKRIQEIYPNKEDEYRKAFYLGFISLLTLTSYVQELRESDNHNNENRTNINYKIFNNEDEKNKVLSFLISDNILQFAPNGKEIPIKGSEYAKKIGFNYLASNEYLVPIFNQILSVHKVNKDIDKIRDLGFSQGLYDAVTALDHLYSIRSDK